MSYQSFLKIFDFYFLPKRFERSGLLYRICGVEIFRLVILATAGQFVLAIRKREALTSYFVSNPRSLAAVEVTEAWSRFNEIIHLILVFVTLWLAHLFNAKGYPSGVVVMALSTLLNVSLVMLQRWNRIRLLRLMELLKKRGKDVPRRQEP